MGNGTVKRMMAAGVLVALAGLTACSGGASNDSGSSAAGLAAPAGGAQDRAAD